MKIQWQWKLLSEFKPLELYQVWQQREKIFTIEQNEVYLDADGYDIDAWHLQGLGDAGQLIAYARVLLPEHNHGVLSFGRVCVDAQYRRRGIADRLVTQLFSKIKESQYCNFPLHISAQQYLVNFYKKHGFECHGDVYYDGNIPHIGMDTFLSCHGRK